MNLPFPQYNGSGEMDVNLGNNKQIYGDYWICMSHLTARNWSKNNEYRFDCSSETIAHRKLIWWTETAENGLLPKREILTLRMTALPQVN